MFTELYRRLFGRDQLKFLGSKVKARAYRATISGYISSLFYSLTLLGCSSGMEDLCLFHNDEEDHGQFGSGLKLKSFISEEISYPPERKQDSLEGEGGDAHPKSAPDSDKALVTEASDEEKRKDVNETDTSGATSEVTHMLGSAGEDALLGHTEMVREEFGDIDTTDMCFEECVVSSPPRVEDATKTEARLEYESTYLESLSDRDGMLIESVPAPSPASFFRSDTMHVSRDNTSFVGDGDTWRQLSSPQEHAVYHRSCNQFDLTENRGVEFISEKEATEGTLAEESISCQPVRMEKAEFNDVSTLGFAADSQENCQFSEPLAGIENHPAQSNTTLGSHSNLVRDGLCLRSALSDPITGAFLDDAMVAQCGHSFGSGSLQKVMETHVCITCGATTSPDLLFPNFALRTAVMAYKEEQEQMTITGLKRKREVPEQDEASEASKLERGNKRTPERFVGREAVISTQCLNGWYLVKTLDTGESVRLQYRSLQKLGDTEIPSTSMRDYFLPEQRRDCSGSPTERVPTKAVAFGELESACPDGPPNTGNGTLDEQNVKESNPTKLLGSSITMEDNLTPQYIANDLPSNQERNIGDHFIEEGPKVTEVSGHEDTDILRCDATVDKAVSVPALENFKTDLPNGDSTFHKISGDDRMAEDGRPGEANFKLRVEEKTDLRLAHASVGEETPPSEMLPTDPVQDANDQGCPTGSKDQESNVYSLRTSSRRTSRHLRNSLPARVCEKVLDPYRKVYGSGCRRGVVRGLDLDVANPDGGPGGTVVNDIGQGSASSSSEARRGGSLESGEHGRETKVKSSCDIFPLMRNEMLKLEKQIPRYYLTNSWRSNRREWRKAVKASFTVLELGSLVQEFRRALLLSAPGGMTDEEFQRHLAAINESRHVDLLVTVWEKLNVDLCRCLNSRPKISSTLDHSFWERLLNVEAKDLSELDLSGDDQSVSFNQMTVTITTSSCVVDECQQSADQNMKSLLSSTMMSLQKQSQMELQSFKEALEQEKRHIIAKLARLDNSSLVGNSLTGGLPPEEGSDIKKMLTVRFSMPGQCDGVFSTQDVDGEATDMSDFD
ncbi:hypothetical protein R1flu_005942 [Riccia fluitans]|uniref:PUB 62/63 C-terminal domain-containing protein n=1 Tax=Riccia fluitans TaxID=41844 RepID=A0ABD1YVC0_9MARC